MKVNLIKPQYLLSILNQTNNNIQLPIKNLKKSQARLPSLQIIIKKGHTKFRMDICKKPTDSERYVPFKSNQPEHFLTKIPFSIARKICTIAENENVKLKRLKELKTKIARTKIL